MLKLEPHRALVRNNLGATLCRLGRYVEAEEQFRRAVDIRPDYPDAYCNLGTLLRWMGRIAEAERPLRRAVKLNPQYAQAHSSLGMTLILLGRLGEARDCFISALRSTPRHGGATFGMGQIAQIEGRFDEAAAMYKRALKINPQMPSAWSALVGLRKMSSADAAWLEGAEKIAESGIAPHEEADLRYAIGKYYDDVDDYELAFRSYKRANELQKTAAESYQRDARTCYVDDLIRVYTRKALSCSRGGSDSARPVFVVGMMRSGTTLVAQIIASHPATKAAGELPFWSEAVRKHEAVIRHESLGEPIRNNLAQGYLRTLAACSADALRVIDKSTFNSDYLGIIHSVFPHASMIYLRRDPIDTCLSCYFQEFSTAQNFTMDLSDLAHYYLEHRRLVAHWRSVLPQGTLLDVPYAELVADQEKWTRKIIDFLGLDWNQRCLDFHKTKRPVMTASFWQVRQKMYRRSVARWRNYEKFIGPLLALRDLDP